MADHIELEVTFLPPDQGGRALPLQINGYRPHLRVPPNDTLLGVEFVGLNGTSPVGTPFTAFAKLVYASAVSYSAFQPGADVEVLEGSQVVGHGRVVGLGSPPNNSFKPNPLRGSA